MDCLRARVPAVVILAARVLMSLAVCTRLFFISNRGFTFNRSLSSGSSLVALILFRWVLPARETDRLPLGRSALALAFASPRHGRAGAEPSRRRPISSSVSTGTTSRPPTPAKPTATVVTVEEREAVLKALNKAGKPLVMWKLSESSGIPQRRLERILAFLVREGIVKRVEAADAVRYSGG